MSPLSPRASAGKASLPLHGLFPRPRTEVCEPGVCKAWGDRTSPASVETRGARTQLAAPSFASISRRAGAAFVPALPGSPASWSPASPYPACCPGHIPGQSRRDPDSLPSFLQETPSRRARLSLRAMFLLPPSRWLWLPGSFNQRQSFPCAGVQLGCRGHGGGHTAANGDVHSPEGWRR